MIIIISITILLIIFYIGQGNALCSSKHFFIRCYMVSPLNIDCGNPEINENGELIISFYNNHGDIKILETAEGTEKCSNGKFISINNQTSFPVTIGKGNEIAFKFDCGKQDPYRWEGLCKYSNWIRSSILISYIADGVEYAGNLSVTTVIQPTNGKVTTEGRWW